MRYKIIEMNDIVDVSSKQENIPVWDLFWKGFTPESEIRMWDFYGGRPWVLKHVPRYGKVLEAGCGLGRYVFYLSQLGIDIEGLDFHRPTVEAVRKWSGQQGFECKFHVGDVTQLPYETESLSGCLSFGVIEHFKEGPEKALAEAYRVLRPGGIAIISTPSISFAQLYFLLRNKLKDIVKTFIGTPIEKKPFFQYWYSPRKLRSLVESCGLRVVLWGANDLKYAFWELEKQTVRWFRLADFLERTPLARWGAQAFTVSVKIGDEMCCFLCGQKKVISDKWHKHYLPICDDCSTSPLANYYLRRKRPHFHACWQYDPVPPSDSSSNKGCHFCGEIVESDTLFEDFGFCVPICCQCLQIPMRNLVASNEFLQPRWRPR